MNSRIVLLIAAGLMALAIVAPTAWAAAAPSSSLPVLTAASSSTLALAGQEVPKKIDMDIDVNSGRPWYRQSSSIAIGIGMVLLVVVLLAVAGRGRPDFIRGKE